MYRVSDVVYRVLMSISVPLVELAPPVMFAPEEDEEDAEEHAAEVGEVCHTLLRAGDTVKEFKRPVQDNEPFGLSKSFMMLLT